MKLICLVNTKCRTDKIVYKIANLKYNYFNGKGSL